jgi:hypothetical protein
MASALILPSFSAKTSAILNDDGSAIKDSFAPLNGSMFRNGFINGNFDIWQRATSQTASGYGSADRWLMARAGSTNTTSRQAFTLGQTDVPNNPKYYVRHVVASSAGASNFAVMRQNIEDVTKYAGQTVTISFYAKADAAKPISVTADQSFGTGGSPSAQVSITGVKTTLSTSWARYTVQLAIPSVSGKTLGTNGDDYFQIQFWMDAGSDYNARTVSLGQQSGTFEFAQCQIEAGSSATRFEQRPIGIEESLCQRYALRLLQVGVSTRWGHGHALSTTQVQAIIALLNTMRATPTLSVSTVTGLTASDGVAGTALTTLILISGASSPSIVTLNFTVASGLTQYRPYWLEAASYGGVIMLEAEL